MDTTAHLDELAPAPRTTPPGPSRRTTNTNAAIHHNPQPERSSTPHADQTREVLRRLVRFSRTPPPCRIPHSPRGRRASEPHASRDQKPSAAAGKTIARAAAEYQQAQKHNRNVRASLKEIVAQIGPQSPRVLTAAQIDAVVTKWREAFDSPHTLANYSKCLRRFLEWLEDIGAAPRAIAKAVPTFPLPAPRTIVATDEERQKLFDAASPRMFFFLSLCADMGLRHRTASSITLGNYDFRTHSLTFTTKGNVHQTLPVPTHIRLIIERLDSELPKNVPIINFLRVQHIGEHQPGHRPRLYRSWTALKEKCGIRPELHIHDLRRTLAEDVWHATKDIRVVQAQLGHRSPTTTARYLANRVGLDDLTEAMERIEQMRRERDAQKAKPPQSERREA